MEIVWILAGIGGLLGAAIALFLGINSHHAVGIYSRSYFGIPANDLVFYLVVLFGIPVVATLITLSVIVRDLEFPNSNPVNFTVETLMMAFLPAVGILLMPLLRGYSYTEKTAFQFLLAVLRFGGLHILLQFSGFWSDLFPPVQMKERFSSLTSFPLINDITNFGLF